MREVKASEFKAKCLKLIDEVNESGEPLIVTKHGAPVVRVEPVNQGQGQALLGSMKGLIEIVDPDDDLEAWDDEMERAMEESLDHLARDLDRSKAGKSVRRG